MKNLLLIVAVLGVGSLISSTARGHGPYVTYYSAPVYAAPAPVVVTSYYAPAPVVSYEPAYVYRTRYRPLLGGTVTRVRPGYVPVVYGY